MKQYLLVSMVLTVLMMPALASCNGQSLAGDSLELKAAIADQLYVLEPNQPFIDEITKVLNAWGFSVDLWQGEDVTVSFYRELPKHGYKLIIFRAHSGILGRVTKSKVTPVETTYLFTGETYNTTRNIAEQLTDQVANAAMNTDYPLVFAVNAEFVRDAMVGRFDNTVIVMMGCHSLSFEDLAVAFVQKGASAYLGWNASVTLDYVDSATLNLIAGLFTENLAVERGIDKTLTEVGPDPYYHAYLRYYPANTVNLTVSELIQ